MASSDCPHGNVVHSIGVVRRTLGLNSHTEGPKQLTMLASYCSNPIVDTKAHQILYRRPWIIPCGSMSECFRPQSCRITHGQCASNDFDCGDWILYVVRDS